MEKRPMKRKPIPFNNLDGMCKHQTTPEQRQEIYDALNNKALVFMYCDQNRLGLKDNDLFFCPEMRKFMVNYGSKETVCNVGFEGMKNLISLI